MIEIRIHGRGGQGAVVASLILARAGHAEGWNVQVFPEFGVERRGVPVTAFARLDRQPIYLRTRVYRPDHVIVLDPALVQFINVTTGLKENGWVVMNSTRPPSSFSFSDRYRVATVDANNIAAKYKIGTSTTPIVNTTMVGAFARATRLVSLKSLSSAIKETITGPASAPNIQACNDAFTSTLLPHTILEEALMEAEQVLLG